MSNSVFKLKFSSRYQSVELQPLVFMLLITHATLSSADNINSACLPELIANQQPIPAMVANPENAPKYIEADSLKQLSPELYALEGKTLLKQPGLVVLSDKVTYNKKNNQAAFTGHVELHQPDITITADKATIDSQNKTAELNDTRYQLMPSRAHGKSKSIEINETKQLAELERANLTTCKLDKNGTSDWDLKFEKLEINDKTRRVVGNNTTLYIKGVPVFYTPYFDYPLDDRASGLLFPELGSYKSVTDDARHQYAKIPYYFNIAANMDDTLSLIPISQRGLALDNEFRYMAKTNDILHSAELTVTALNDQVVAADGLALIDTDGNVSYGDKDSNRWRAKLKANQRWNQHLTSSINWQEVSDEVFFKDIPVETLLKNASYRQRYARMDYRNGNLHAYARVLGYMRLQNAADNYEKRPELGLNYFKDIGAFDFDLDADFSDFYVPVSDHTRPEGVRLHLEPKITYRMQNSYAYLNTSAGAYMTQYQMVDNDFNPSEESSFNRSIPQFSVHGGLIFEREISLLEKDFIQTLEPEFQFLDTAYVDQQNIALFDTNERTLAFDNLFALNRFTGADRIGDTRQISMAITSRLLQNNGQQLAEAGIGQIAYLKDRKVGLDAIQANNIETSEFSDVFVKLGLNLKNWYFSSTTQFDQDDFKLTNANSRIKWQQGNHLFMLNHSLYDANTADEIDMISLGANSRLDNRWELGLYSSYNLTDESIYETQIGLRYDSCCWAAEILAERTQLENGLYNDGIQVQFELKGLSTSQSGFRKTLTDKLNF